MIEPITEEKLRQYGFSDLDIERLKTWDNHECKMTNGTDFFYASNITGLIYTGEDGYDKFRNIGIDRFKTFDDMFQRAVEIKSIDLYTDPNLSASYKLALYQTDRSIYNSDFNAWLQKFKNWEYGNEPQYREFLTKEVWIEFLAYRQNQKEERLKRHETEKASWQVKNITEIDSREARIEKALAPMMRLQKQLESGSFQDYEVDRRKCLEGWQYVEPAAQSPENRYDLDKEAYIKHYFDPAHIHDTKFDEAILIERLIKNLQAAKHPVFIEYRMFLESKLNAGKSMEQDQQTEDIRPRREVIRKRLSKYGFCEYLRDQKRLKAAKITEIENALCTKKPPYCIALLKGLGYLDYFTKEYCNGKAANRDKLLAKVFDTTERRVKGNINVLNTNSAESRENFTSHLHTEEIDKLLKG